MKFIIVSEFLGTTPLVFGFNNEQEALQFFEVSFSSLRITLYENGGSGLYVELKTRKFSE